MLLKVHTFLVNKAAELAALPLVATLKTGLKDIIDAIIEARGEADEDLTGTGELKQQKQQAAFDQGMKVAKAATLYFGVIIHDPVLLRKVDLLKSELQNMRDTDLYVRLKKLFKITDPVKALMVAPDFADTDVTQLNTLNEDYFEVLEAPTDARSEASSYNKEADRLLLKAIDHLEEKLDIAIETFSWSDTQLVDYYHSSRLIDDTGSRSELSGFDLTTYTIPGNTSISIQGAPDSDVQVYIKNNGPSSLGVCTRPNATDSCAVGGGSRVLAQNEEYLGSFSGLEIGMEGFIILTNLGGLQITVRGGTKHT